MGSHPEMHSKIFSPSSGERLIACPGSAKACKDLPEVNSIFSSEGTDAHELAAHEVNKLIGVFTEDPRDHLKYFNKEMEDYVSGYVSFINEKLEKSKQEGETVLKVEQEVGTSKFGERLFGTSDCILYNKDTKELSILDLKYGMGILVSAEENVQLKIYALFTMDQFNDFDVDKINLIIYQPRKSNISEWSTTKKELLEWEDKVLKPTIQKILNGSEEFHSGEHCRFCRAKGICKALQETSNKITRLEIKSPNLLNDDEIDEILKQAEPYLDWISAVREYALSKAINGYKYKNWKLVEGKSNRILTNELKAVECLKNIGFDPYERKLKSLSVIQKELGTPRFNSLLGNLVTKPIGKPILVSRDDKRPELTNLTNTEEK